LEVAGGFDAAQGLIECSVGGFPVRCGHRVAEAIEADAFAANPAADGARLLAEVARRASDVAAAMSEEASEMRGRGLRARAETRDARALRRSWAQLIKRVYEVDPLVCPRCHGEMRMIAFIVDAVVIDKILRHLVAKGDHRVRGPPQYANLEAVS
jgi:hypothetical protein